MLKALVFSFRSGSSTGAFSRCRDFEGGICLWEELWETEQLFSLHQGLKTPLKAPRSAHPQGTAPELIHFTGNKTYGWANSDPQRGGQDPAPLTRLFLARLNVLESHSNIAKRLNHRIT